MMEAALFFSEPTLSSEKKYIGVYPIIFLPYPLSLFQYFFELPPLLHAQFLTLTCTYIYLGQLRFVMLHVSWDFVKVILCIVCMQL